MEYTYGGVHCDFSATIFHLKGGLNFNHRTTCRPGRFWIVARLSRRGVLTIPLYDELLAPAAVTRFDVFIGKRMRDGVPLLRTPDDCNRQRGWKTRTTVTYEDGSAETTTTKQPCGRRR